MKTILLYANRSVGINSLLLLKTMGYTVVVVTEDDDVASVAEELSVPVINFGSIQYFDYDLFICIHGRKIIPNDWLKENKMINIHPCLHKYKGHNPIKRYIIGKDTDGTVESQWLTEVVDGGEVIHREDFKTPICNTYADFYNVAFVYYTKCLIETLKKVGI